MDAMTETANLTNGFRRDEATTYTLRRTGRKSVRFEGWQLIEALGSVGGRDVWHDLNVYRTVKDLIVVELITRRRLSDQQDLSRLQTFNDINAAAQWLENYRAAEDVPIPGGLGSPDTALPWSVLQAVQLRQSIDRLESDYRSMLSEVFAALDLTDQPEPRTAPAESEPAPENSA